MSTPERHEAGRASRNLGVLIAVSGLLGLGVAVYENVLPFYLVKIHLSARSMGWIFAAGALCTYLFRVGAGVWSDRAGRKLVYGLSLIGQGLAGLFTPLVRGALGQGVLKCVREPAVRTRETMHSVLLYDESRPRFLDLFGKSRGAEFLFQCFGLLLAALGLKLMLRRGVTSPSEFLLMGSGVLLVLATLVFHVGFRPPALATEGGPTSARLRVRDILRPQLNRELWILAGAEFIFNIGLSCSHSFVMPLFFRDKFGASESSVLVIMALHRLSIALPMLFIGWFVKERLKRVYVVFVFLEGVLIAVPGFIGALIPAAAIWLLHDFFGAGLWLPAQHALLQQYSHPHMRGKQVSIVLALGSLGTVVGFLLAGFLAGMKSVAPSTAISLPFIVGGALVAVTSFVVARL